jgi:hypothetical protein
MIDIPSIIPTVTTTADDFPRHGPSHDENAFNDIQDGDPRDLIDDCAELMLLGCDDIVDLSLGGDGLEGLQVFDVPDNDCLIIGACDDDILIFVDNDHRSNERSVSLQTSDILILIL